MQGRARGDAKMRKRRISALLVANEAVAARDAARSAQIVESRHSRFDETRQPGVRAGVGIRPVWRHSRLMVLVASSRVPSRSRRAGRDLDDSAGARSLAGGFRLRKGLSDGPLRVLT